MSTALDWDREGQRWPHHSASRFVEAGGLRWHVQHMGTGPTILLLHGTGASVHSWHRLMPLLAERFSVLAIDLPRHAFTHGRPQGGSTLPGFATSIAALLAELDTAPELVVGHSAGAAIALQMSAMGQLAAPIVGLNSAIMPFPGTAAQLFPTLAKALFVNPFVPRLFSGAARLTGGTERFLKRATGSRVDPVSARCYATLFGNSRHCAGALDMMAHWDLEALKARFGGITAPILLVHSAGDQAIPPDIVREADLLLKTARLEMLPDLGHLAHEEAPDIVAPMVCDFAAEHGILSRGSD